MTQSMAAKLITKRKRMMPGGQHFEAKAQGAVGLVESCRFDKRLK